MKEPVAILLFVVVIFLGWEQPFEARYQTLKALDRNIQALASLRLPVPANNGSSADGLAIPDLNIPLPANNGSSADGLALPDLNAPPENVPPGPDSSGDKDDNPPSWMWRKGKLDSRQQGVDRTGIHTYEPLLRN